MGNPQSRSPALRTPLQPQPLGPPKNNMPLGEVVNESNMISQLEDFKTHQKTQRGTKEHHLAFAVQELEHAPCQGVDLNPGNIYKTDHNNKKKYIYIIYYLPFIHPNQVIIFDWLGHLPSSREWSLSRSHGTQAHAGGPVNLPGLRLRVWTSHQPWMEYGYPATRAVGSLRIAPATGWKRDLPSWKLGGKMQIEQTPHFY